jgi:hypothetical protein
LIHASELEACPFFFLNFKGTPSQEEHNNIFSGLGIDDMGLSDHTVFLAFFRLRKVTYLNLINFGIRLSVVDFAP